MAIAAGTCPNCGHAEKRVLKEGRARTIFTCPECQKGRIIARKIKMENPNGDGKEGNGNKETITEGSGGESGKEGEGEENKGKKEEAPGNPPSEDEKTNGKSKGKVSSVKKVSYAKRESSGEGTSSVSGKGNSTSKRSASGTRNRKAPGNSSRKPASTGTKREPRKREPKRETVAASTAQDKHSEASEDWRGIYPYVY